MASDLDTVVRKAVEERLEAQFTALPIQWPKVPFDPPAAGYWVRPAIIFAESDPLTGGTGVTGNQFKGILSISVFGPPGEGYGTVNGHADSLRDVFSRWSAADGSLHFLAPNGPRPVGDGEDKDGDGAAHAQVVVTFPFFGREA